MKHLAQPLPLSGQIQQKKINDIFFLYFSQKILFDITCRLSSMETICMKVKPIFWGKCFKRLLNFLPSMLSL